MSTIASALPINMYLGFFQGYTMGFALPQHLTIKPSLPQYTPEPAPALVKRKGCDNPREGFVDPAGNNLTLVTCYKDGQAAAAAFLQPLGIVPAPLQTSPKQSYQLANWDSNYLYATNATAVDVGANLLLQNKTSEANHQSDVSNHHAMIIGMPISAGVTAALIGLFIYFKCCKPVARQRSQQREIERRRVDVERATGSYELLKR